MAADVWNGRRPASLRSAALVAALVAGGLCGPAAAPALAAGWMTGARGDHPAHGIEPPLGRQVHPAAREVEDGRRGMLPPSNGRLAAADPDLDAHDWHHARLIGNWPTAAADTASPRRPMPWRPIRRPNHKPGQRFGRWHPASHWHWSGVSAAPARSHAGRPALRHPAPSFARHANPLPAHTRPQSATHAARISAHAAVPKVSGHVPAVAPHTAPPKYTVPKHSAPRYTVADHTAPKTVIPKAVALKSRVRAHADPLPPASKTAPAKPGTKAAKPAKPTTAAKVLPAVLNTRTATAIKAAYAALGTPYRWGGTGPSGYDCSGLMQHIWHEAGVAIPRTSSQQAVHGKAVNLNTISPGDLVIFYRGGHVGIYVGDGMVIHSPHTGAVVRLERMKDMPIYDIRRYS